METQVIKSWLRNTKLANHRSDAGVIELRRTLHHYLSEKCFA